mgnify:CR=1 FL=1
MEISIYNQLLTVLFSVVLGAFCGILYDLVKIFRKILVPEYNKKLINKQSKKQYKGISNPIFKSNSSFLFWLVLSDITLTLSCSPTFNTSDGCLMYLFEINDGIAIVSGVMVTFVLRLLAMIFKSSDVA